MQDEIDFINLSITLCQLIVLGSISLANLLGELAALSPTVSRLLSERAGCPCRCSQSSRPDFNNGHQVSRCQGFDYGAGLGVTSFVPVA